MPSDPSRGDPGRATVTAFLAMGNAGIEAARATLASLAANTAGGSLRLAIWSPDALASPLEEELAGHAAFAAGGHAWCLLPESGHPDVSSALAAAAARAPGDDVVVVTAGAVLPFAWNARLRKAAYASARIGAVVPMCDAVAEAALVDEALQGPALDTERIDRTAYSMGQRSYYEIPRLHAACAYLRRDAFDAAFTGAAGAENNLQSLLDTTTRRLRALGWNCVIVDYVYVGFAGSPPERAPAGDGIDEKAFLQHHPLGGLRRAVNDAVRAGLPPVSVPGLDERPVQLHIMHFWGGGLERWVRDFGRADPSRINLVLATYRIGESGGQRVVLYSDPAALLPIRTWDIAAPIRSTVPSSIEYREILEQILAEFDVEAIVVSSLIGHSLEALTQPRRTLVVCHDLYPICQAINPIFGKTCERCTVDDLRGCAKDNPLNRIFVDRTTDEWQALRERYVDLLLERGIEMVVPSAWVAATMRRIAPRLEAVPIHVIPHGIDMDVAPLPVEGPAERLRVVVLGRLSLHKGAELLREAAGELREFADVTLVGCGPGSLKLAAECGWKAIEKYELDSLPELLRSLAPHAAVLASVVPETFSYTLSELWALAVPPVATALGSFQERIAEGETGFLFEPTSRGLVDVLRKLHAGPERLHHVATTLAHRPKGRTALEMVAGYNALLPMQPRQVARFPVGVGRQTALTEPYRHLSEAYSQLLDANGRLDAAYAQTSDAYQQSREAYERVRGELDRTRDLWRQMKREFEALDVSRHWWRADKARQVVADFHEKAIHPGGTDDAGSSHE